MQADEEHLDATARLATARRRRDAAARDLYRWLVRVRRLAGRVACAAATDAVRTAYSTRSTATGSPGRTTNGSSRCRPSSQVRTM